MRRPCRVVCKTTDPEWQSHRKELVTGSKALESGVGLLVPEEHPMRTGKARHYKDGDADPRALWFGTQKEPIVGACLRRFGGLHVRPFPYLLASTAYPGLAASFDFLARWPSSPSRRLAMSMGFEWMPWSQDGPEPGELVVVEVKCRSLDPGWVHGWDSGKRLTKKGAWQGQAQMSVIGARFCLWALHIDHAEIHLGFQRSDPTMAAALAQVAEKKYGAALTPPADDHKL